MDQSSLSALYGALSNELRMNTITNNLANANTSGYKKDRLTFEDTFIRYAHDWEPNPRPSIRTKKLLPDSYVVAKPRLALQTVDFSQGPLQVTGNKLDLALNGPGFFKVQSDEGEMYTRNGEFYRSNEGILVNTEGYTVLGDGGEIEIPDGRRIDIDRGGRIFVDGAQIGTIDVVSVDNEEGLMKVGQNLFTPKDGAAVGEAAVDVNETTVNQGYLEKTNIQVVEEMAHMIETQRAHEAYTKVLQTTDTLDKSTISKVGNRS
ncbi:flagellar basal-body rod protein FlgF [Desulfovibrio inopinatus]|uniref:flagellar basal-body rod protein FlgF n=1 Tax=Desulfovibrio inopinatus TaxID=102109 RepID=UPI0003FEDAC9|nr:flagellar basal-body rod protein FlgF [Desulfovibrio inopinatus]